MGLQYVSEESLELGVRCREWSRLQTAEEHILVDCRLDETGVGFT